MADPQAPARPTDWRADLELLRRAAVLMRERAQAANTDDARRPYSERPVPPEQWGELVDNYLGGVIGQHCAFWTPTVALAVADWLDAEHAHFSPIWTGPHVPDQLARALAVARAYLRRDRDHIA